MRTSDPAVSWEEDVNPDSQNGWKSSLTGVVQALTLPALQNFLWIIERSGTASARPTETRYQAKDFFSVNIS